MIENIKKPCQKSIRRLRTKMPLDGSEFNYLRSLVDDCKMTAPLAGFEN